MEFSRPEYWSGYPFPSPEDLLNPGIELESSLPTELSGSKQNFAWKAPCPPLLPVPSAVKSAYHCHFHSFPCIHFLNILYLHALVPCSFLGLQHQFCCILYPCGWVTSQEQRSWTCYSVARRGEERGEQGSLRLAPFHFEAHMELCVETGAPSSPPAFLSLDPFRAYLCVPLSHQNLSSRVLTSCPLDRLLTHLLPSRWSVAPRNQKVHCAPRENLHSSCHCLRSDHNHPILHACNCFLSEPIAPAQPFLIENSHSC